jgi:predicted XRE-type DNA-binding protein
MVPAASVRCPGSRKSDQRVDPDTSPAPTFATIRYFYSGIRAARVREEVEEDLTARPGCRASAVQGPYDPAGSAMNRRSVQKTRGRKGRARYARKRKAPAVVREPLPEGTTHVTPAGGNVFRDLGFPPAQAENLLIRSDLMTVLQRLMLERGLTQVQAAKLFGVSQPRISDLKRDKIDRFTIDTLINMLAYAGVRVRLKIDRTAA